MKTRRELTLGARQREAKWWFKNVVNPFAFTNSQVGRKAAQRLRDLRLDDVVKEAQTAEENVIKEATRT